MVSMALQDAYFRHPPQVWTIDSSWPLQNSSLVYLGVKFGLCLLWLDLIQTSQQSPATTRGVSVDPISSSCVKEYPSLLQSKKSASYQTLRMWVAGPHRRTPHLGPFVSSSEDSLHQPERASSSSVRPEGLRTPVGRPVGSSVLRQHHHSNVCPSPASFIMGSSNVSADSFRRHVW